MVTKVGMQSKIEDAVKDLLELDYDAVEAYKAAVERLDNAEYKQKLAEFQKDHERHTTELTQLLRQHNITPPTEADAKKWLTKGKVVIAGLVGDNAILLAMKTNEADTNTAYERVAQRDDLWADGKDIVQRGWSDEKRHAAWIDSVLKS
jgi:rubrerythrin